MYYSMLSEKNMLDNPFEDLPGFIADLLKKNGFYFSSFKGGLQSGLFLVLVKGR